MPAKKRIGRPQKRKIHGDNAAAYNSAAGELCAALGISAGDLNRLRKIPGAPALGDVAAWVAFHAAHPIEPHNRLKAEHLEEDGVPVIVADASGIERGAAATLRRLEEQEASAYAAMSAAQKDANIPDGTRGKLHKRWLELSAQLRQYDLQIEASRRDAGELLPRSEVESCVRAVATHLRLAVVQALNQQLGVTDQRDAILRDVGNLVRRCLDRGQECSEAVPAWAVAPVLEGMQILP